MRVSTQHGRLSSGQAEWGHPADGRGDNLHWYCASCSDIHYFCFDNHSVSWKQMCTSFKYPSICLWVINRLFIWMLKCILGLHLNHDSNHNLNIHGCKCILVTEAEVFIWFSPSAIMTYPSSYFIFYRQQECCYQRTARPNEEWLHRLQYGTFQYWDWCGNVSLYLYLNICVWEFLFTFLTLRTQRQQFQASMSSVQVQEH